MNHVLEEIKANLKTVKVYEKVKISPHVARELLEMNTGNRRVTDALVRSYTTQMKKDQWKFTGDPIQISRTGRIINAQHRLYAIVASETTQLMNIQTGLDDNVFDVIDTGRNRTPADVLSISGYANPGTLQATVKLIMLHDTRKMSRSSEKLQKAEKATNHQIIEWIEGERTEIIHECVSEGQKFYSRSRLFSSPTYAAFLYLFSRKDKEAAKEFFEKLVSGENLERKSPIYCLRNRITNLKISNKYMDTVEKYALIIKSWNFWREGKAIDRILWTEEEDFPKIK